MEREYDLFLPWKGHKTKEIFDVIDDELFFRLNPHWIIESFVTSEGVFTVEITDHATDQSAVLKGTIVKDSMGFPSISGDSHEWSTLIFFEKNGSLHVRVIYADEPEEEVERTLVLWLRSIKEYLRLYATSTINTRLFRLLMNRIILKMTPSQRKISLMLIRITILELLVILLILVGWIFFR